MALDPILIVGAGPTGLLLAIWIKTLDPNIEFRIIDKAAGPGTTSRALILHARNLEFYQQLGIATKLYEQATVIESFCIRPGGHEKARLNVANAGEGLSRFPVVLSFPQDEHERFLVSHLESLGVQVEWNTELTEIVEYDDYMQVTLAGEQTRVSYVAGCDGSKSAVRKISDIPMEGGTYAQRFFVADVEVPAGQESSAITICPIGPEFAIYIPLNEQGHVRIVGAVSIDNKGEDCTFVDVEPKIQACTALKCIGVNWFATYKVHHRLAATFRKDRIFLLGDAAHLHSPVGGQGMNAGLGDATNLGWKLVSVMQGKASKGLLDTYSSERAGFAKILIDTTDRLFTLITDAGFVGTLLRRVIVPYVFPVIFATPGVSRLFFKRISQIGIRYRDSALSQNETVTGNIQAGDRLPWILFDDGSDNFGPLAARCWQIHVYAKTRAETWDFEGVPIHAFPFTNEVRSANLSPDAAYLVRPDGHVGLVCKDFDHDALTAYFSRWGLA
ncbi:hypothetical protein MBLNU459_g0185t1 [Dothideomycetes sp. NU459]